MSAAPRSATVLPRPPGLVRRLLATHRHLAGLLAGALVAEVTRRRADGASGLAFLPLRVAAGLVRPFLMRELRHQPFPVQLRRRLEILGPTYIKLGQVLSLREDILPKAVTDELKLLLSRLPPVPMEAVRVIVERDLNRSLESAFAWVSPEPLGSASIAQTHRATTREGDAVVLKVVKPGIRETLERDARLLGILGWMLELAFARFQPKKMIREFTEYTLREVDLRREADNAATFTANFADVPDVVFPRIYREYSARNVLCMEYFEGPTPEAPDALALPEDDRRRLTDLGALAIIRMLYRDGFFHADLHPGNLIILGEPGARRVGFIDLGMVGRLDEELRRTLLFYYYALVMGDAESAARYLSAVADAGPGGDPMGFRREVVEISQRWRLASSFEGFSLGRLILESVARGAQYGMYFPVEMVLMVKALVTFEGVGHVLLPGMDVAELSRRHVRRVFLQQFSPVRLIEETIRGAPDVVDAMVKMPLLMTEGLRVLEKAARRHPENPLAGLRGTLLAGASLVAGAVVLAQRGPWAIAVVLFGLAIILAVRKGA